MFKPKMCLKEVFCCRWLCTLQSECGQAFVSPHRGHWHNTHRQTIRLQNYPAPRSPPSGRVCERKSVSGDSPPKTAASTAKLRCCHTPHLWVLPGSTSASDSLFFLWGKVEEDFSLSKNQELLPQSFSVEERCLSPSIILLKECNTAMPLYFMWSDIWPCSIPLPTTDSSLVWWQNSACIFTSLCDRLFLIQLTLQMPWVHQNL